MALGAFVLNFVRLYDYDWMSAVFLGGGLVVFIAGLCGAYCGLSLIFTVRGVPKLIAVLVALVSLYAIVRCLGFFGWAINLP